HWPLAAVGNVDAVLLNAAVALVVLQQRVVRKVGEDAPHRVVAEHAIADGDARAVVDAHRRPVRVERRETVDHEVGGETDLDGVAVVRAVRRRYHYGAPANRLDHDRRPGG